MRLGIQQTLSAAVAVMILCACGAAPPATRESTLSTATPTPTGRASATPVVTVVPSATPFPSSTPTIEPSPTPSPAPEAVVGLTAQEHQRLHESAVKYVAQTQQEAISVARNLGFLIDDGHPSNMCGPLAIAILRDAGLVDRYVILHDYWLLDPREPADARALQSIFPERRTAWFESDTSVGEFDFAAFPLQAGDLLYLRAGLRGTFEHVIVVTRVDEQGRAYSVTNVNTEAGFVIREVLLYDPRQPGVGAFYEWTDAANAHLGLTGCGGFQLWRLTEVVRPEESEVGRALCRRIDRILETRGGHWRVLIKRVGGDVIYYRRAEEVFQDPSALQVPAAMVFFHALDRQGVGDYASYLTTHGTQDRSFDQLLGAVLLGADEEAARALAGSIGGQVNVDETFADWGLFQTTLAPGQSTAWDTALALEGLYAGSFVSEEARAWTLGTMTTGAGRLGVLREHLEDVRVYGVQADTAEGRLIVSEAAIVDVGGESYVLVIHASEPGYGEGETTAEDLAQAVEEVALAFGIDGLDPGTEAMLETLRDMGITARVWGQLRTGARVIIDEVYAGTRYDDTCLAEIQVWGRAR